MKNCFLVGLLMVAVIVMANPDQQEMIESYDQMQGNRLTLNNRNNYNHYWMKYLPTNYRDYTSANEFQYSEENQYGWDNNTWIEVYSYEYFYSNGYLTGMYTMYGAMEAQSEVTYDANNRIHQITLSFFNGTTWDVYMRETFEYNANGILNYYLKEMYTAGNWINNEQFLFTLDGDHITLFIDQDWDDGSQTWLNDEQFTLTWDGETVTEVLRQDWYFDNWDNSMLYGYTYVVNKLSESLSQYWNGTIWINSSMKYFTWDGDLIVNVFTEGWNGYEWEDQMDQTYTFDANGNPLELLGLVWDYDISLWVNDHRIEYLYNSGINNNNIPNSAFKLINYPNPFNPTTTISYQLPDNGMVELTVFNLKGQKVKHLVSKQRSAGQHYAVWNGKDENNKPVSSGIYFYKLKTNNFEETKKMILMK